MRAPVTEYLDGVARQCVPFGITLFFVIVGAVAVPIPQYGAVASAAALMSIYYWTVYRDNLMPAVAVFTIGLLQDNLGGTPLGLSALELLLGYALIRSQQRFLQGKSFIVHWAGFVVFALAVGLGKWILMMMLNGLFIDIGPIVFHLFIEIALYPCMAWLLWKAQHAFLRQV